MENEELKRLLVLHFNWRYNTGIACRLINTEISCIDADIENADFRDAIIEGAYFPEANFPDSKFSGAVLNGACFDYANLKGADFRRADLNGATFYEADLRGLTFATVKFSLLNLEEQIWKELNFQIMRYALKKGILLAGSKYKVM
jgi:uncharacterized protein YjbI with pentapeptide repeats